jgi:hypothetical protein
MKSVLSALLAVATMAFATGPSQAQDALATFGATCRANPDFFSFAVADLDAAGAGQLCSCLAAEFAGFSGADLAMLGKDIDGTATAADRTAFGDYTALELRARDALNKCIGSPAQPAVEGADMTRFDAACTGSEMLLQFLADDRERAVAVRGEFCGCLSVALVPQVSTADADMLAADLDETATEASRSSYPGYTELSGKAGAAFDSCFASIAPAQ